MNKIFTVILSDEFSTSEVIKLFAGEFDNLEICQENDSDCHSEFVVQSAVMQDS